MIRSSSICLLFMIIAITGCGTGSGPGSPSDAVRFGNSRISELKQPVIQQDASGNWYKSAKEIRNARPGFVSGTFKKLRAEVTYEYRDLETEQYDKKEDAELAEPKLAREEWQKAQEVYVFKSGTWTIEREE